MRAGTSGWLIAFVLGVLLHASVSYATETNAQFDARIVADLTRIAPDAVEPFRQANAARERGDNDAAIAAYAAVRRLAPTFSHAGRRQCGVYLVAHRAVEAVAACREALSIEVSAENLCMLARALTEAEALAGAGEVDDLLRRAEELDTNRLFVAQTQADIAMRRRDVPGLSRAAERCLALAPDDPTSVSVAFIAALADGRYDDVTRHVDHFCALGAPQSACDRMRTLASENTPWWFKAWRIARWLVPTWLAASVALFLLGLGLSVATLRASRRVPTEATGRAVGIDALLRKTYRAVLWLCCVYYYVSLPLVVALVVVAGGGIIYGFMAAGRIPIKLVLIVVVFVFATAWALLKSLFVRSKDEDPGLRLDLSANPRLREVLDEVAGKAGTRPVDAVYVTPLEEVAVFERGGMMQQLRGGAERCLVLGVGVLEGLRLLPLKAVLAHEYGHFRNEDTAGGGFALMVRRSLMEFVMALARGGAASNLNPAWWFAKGYWSIFLRISQGASRLQEVLADRWAAFTYGSDAFAEGFTAVITRSVGFQAHMDATLADAVDRKIPVANLYEHEPVTAPAASTLEERVRQAMEREPTPFDSHPSPRDRLAWVRALAAPVPPDAQKPGEEGAMAWDLFADRPALERAMTERVRELLARQGVEVAG